MDEYRLTVTTHVDAPRLARVFTRGIIERLDISDDARTAVVLMVSDAASDSVRSGHPVTVRCNHVDSLCTVVVEGDGLAPPVVAEMPEGLTVEAGVTTVTIGIDTR